jgi:hypothetical protein
LLRQFWLANGRTICEHRLVGCRVTNIVLAVSNRKAAISAMLKLPVLKP